MKCPECLYRFSALEDYPRFWRAVKCPECEVLLIRKHSVLTFILAVLFFIWSLIMTIHGKMDSYIIIGGVLSFIIIVLQNFAWGTCKVDDRHTRRLWEKALSCLMVITILCGTINIMFIDGLNLYIYRKFIAKDMVNAIDTDMCSFFVLDQDRVVLQTSVSAYLKKVYILDVKTDTMREIQPFYRYIYEDMFWDGKVITGVFGTPDKMATEEYELLSVDTNTLQVINTDIITRKQLEVMRKSFKITQLSSDGEYNLYYGSVYDQTTKKKIDKISKVGFHSHCWAPDKNRLYYCVTSNFFFKTMTLLCSRDYPN